MTLDVERTLSSVSPHPQVRRIMAAEQPGWESLEVSWRVTHRIRGVFRDAPVKIYLDASPTGLDPVPAIIVPMRESVVTIPPAPSELVLLCAGEGKAPLRGGTPEPCRTAYVPAPAPHAPSAQQAALPTG